VRHGLQSVVATDAEAARQLLQRCAVGRFQYGFQ